MISKKVAGGILAAGGSSRFGEIKQLLPWKNKNIINTVVETAALADLDPILVVLGANAGLIQASLDNETVQVVNNTDWDKGQSTSLKAGVTAIRQTVDGVLFLLCDQPHLTVNLVDAVVEEGLRAVRWLHRSSMTGVPTRCTFLPLVLRCLIRWREMPAEGRSSRLVRIRPCPGWMIGWREISTHRRIIGRCVTTSDCEWVNLTLSSEKGEEYS